MAKQTPEYDHTQKGIIQPILLATAATCLGIAYFLRDTPPYPGVLIATAAAVAILSFAFGRLRVRDEGNHLSIAFGPLPLFRKSIAYADISGVTAERFRFLSGWGIHWTPKGWLWNIGGFDCVHIALGGHGFLVGSDDAGSLARFLRSKQQG